MDSILKIIKKRRSIFPPQYNGKVVEEKDIKQILEAANWAPTHAKTEPWRFKVLQGDKKNELGEFLAQTYKETAAKFSEVKFKKMKVNAELSSCAILICMQRDPKERIPEWEEVAAVAMAVQNMWLMTTELGLGAYWSSPGAIKKMGEFVSLNEGEQCLGIFYMGQYDEAVSRTPSSLEEKVTWL